MLGNMDHFKIGIDNKKKQRNYFRYRLLSTITQLFVSKQSDD